jgi:hypothetical protein
MNDPLGPTLATFSKLRRESRGPGLILAALLAALLSSVLPVAAQHDERVTVRLDGRALFRVSGEGGESALARAERIERRLARLLENPAGLALARVEIGGAGGAERVVSVSGVPVITVTQADAQDNLTDVDALAAQWAGIINESLGRARARRLSPWSRFVAEVQSSAQTSFARLIESAITIVPRALAALLVIGLFWALAAGVRWLMRLALRRVVSDRTAENLIKQVAYYAVWALGLIVAADALGFSPQTVVTGLGLTSLALGFALKDIISNFVSGLLILTLRPFELGDQIVIGETEGGG